MNRHKGDNLKSNILDYIGIISLKTQRQLYCKWNGFHKMIECQTVSKELIESE